MIVYIKLYEHYRIFGYDFGYRSFNYERSFDDYNESRYPYWQKRDICKATIDKSTDPNSSVVLDLWRYPSSSASLDLWRYPSYYSNQLICTACLRPCYDNNDNIVQAVWFNGKSYYLYTDQDLYDCMEDLTVCLNNEEMEKVLSTV